MTILRSVRPLPTFLAAATLLGGLTVPAGLGAVTAATRPAAPRPVRYAAAATATPADIALAAYDRMTPEQRRGQLLVVGMDANGTTAAQRAALAAHHVGNVMLFHRTYAGVAAVANVVAHLRTATTQAGVLPFVATDQEGGEVQDLNGPGFSGMPSALYQGRQMAASVLQADAERWGGQLRRAGVNVNFAPVGDVVPASVGTANQPIGRWYREYGYEPVHVAHRVVTVITGMRAAGIATTVKHFPGLGRATGNTDVSTGVTDPTTPTDPYLAPFRAAIAAHVPFVMVSTATYPNIAPHHRAAFSHHVVTWLLRQQLGFRGLVVSDSLTTVAVQDVLPGDRAVRFLAAGGDLVLVTSAAPVASMLEAIHAAAVASPAFHAQVRAAVLAVLTAKAAAGLIPG